MPKKHTMKHEKTESKKERIKEYGKKETSKSQKKEAVSEMKMNKVKQKKMSKIMKEYKAGELNIGKSKKMVKNPKQAIAIGLSVSGMSKPPMIKKKK